jgi:hypothetical protein
MVLTILQPTFCVATRVPWPVIGFPSLNSLAPSIIPTRVGIVSWRAHSNGGYPRIEVILNVNGNAPVANNGFSQGCIGVAKKHLLLAFVTELDIRVTRFNQIGPSAVTAEGEFAVSDAGG